MNYASGQAVPVPSRLGEPVNETSSISNVLEQTQSSLSAIQNQVEELTRRLFDPPRAVEEHGKAPEIERTPCTAERAMRLRNSAALINEQLARVLADL